MWWVRLFRSRDRRVVETCSQTDGLRWLHVLLKGNCCREAMCYYLIHHGIGKY
jgi:hypothetical protein